MRFTALLHHVTPSLPVESFYGLKRDAAAGQVLVRDRVYLQRSRADILLERCVDARFDVA